MASPTSASDDVPVHEGMARWSNEQLIAYFAGRSYFAGGGKG